MSNRLRCLAGLAILAAGLLVTPARAETTYNFTNFSGPNDTANLTTINGISNNGVVVGFTTDAAGNIHNFFGTPPTTFTALTALTSPTSMANGINSNGTIVGVDGNTGFAFMSNGNNTPTGITISGATTSSAFGINDNGTIVGQYTNTNANGNLISPGFLDVNGTITTLNPKTNSTVTNAQGINNKGLVAGFYSTAALGAHAAGFLYDSTTQTFTFPLNPSTPLIMANGLDFTQFLGINDHGLVVGYYQTNDGSQHGLLYDTTTKTYQYLDDPNAATSGVSITQITGITNSGEITGFYVDAKTGAQRGFFATPAAVPEPASLTLLGLGLAGVVGYGRRRGRRVQPPAA